MLFAVAALANTALSTSSSVLPLSHDFKRGTLQLLLLVCLSISIFLMSNTLADFTPLVNTCRRVAIRRLRAGFVSSIESDRLDGTVVCAPNLSLPSLPFYNAVIMTGFIARLCFLSPT